MVKEATDLINDLKTEYDINLKVDKHNNYVFSLNNKTCTFCYEQFLWKEGPIVTYDKNAIVRLTHKQYYMGIKNIVLLKLCDFKSRNHVKKPKTY
jgi:hypothetical protein